MSDSPAVTEDEFRRLCEFLYRRTGMVFTEAKRYYVERRVVERMKATGAGSFGDYFARLRGDAEGEVEHFVNAFTVNETYFYREEHQLRCLTRDLLAQRLQSKPPGDGFRIWSVPCSTGEESARLLCELLDAELEANVCASAVEVLAEVGGPAALPALARCEARFRGTSFLEFAIRITADRIRSPSPAPRA